MSMSDPIADMLTRIRNALRVGRKDVLVRRSKVCGGIAKVLKEEGYIHDFDEIDDNKQGLIRVQLKYAEDGGRVLSELKRESKPGCRLYAGAGDLPRVKGGLGVAIVSTSRGVLSDRQCRGDKLGGEVLCTVS